MKYTLHFLIVFAFTSIFAFPSSAETTYKWRSIGDLDSEWQEGKFANLGFTKNSLEYVINLDRTGHLKDDLFLILSPTYLDEVYIQFIDGQNHSKLVSIGDKYGLYNFEKYEESGIWSIPIPKDSKTITIVAKSTSNLRISANILTSAEYKKVTLKTNTIRAFIIATIVSSGLVSLALWITFRRHVFAFFSLYQFSWLILLAGIDGVALFIINTNWMIYRDAIVSYGVVLAFISGSLCHAVILKNLFKLTWLPNILLMSSATGLILLGVLLMGYDFEALRINSILLSLIPLIICIGAFVEKPKTTDLKNRWKKTRLFYAGLMISVMATGISGLGKGELFGVTYIHAILTTVILSYIILSALSHQRDLTAKQILDDALADASNRIISAQLKDNRALLTMLAHEIKTPLTTIKLMLHKAPNEKAISKQLHEIQDVLDQVSNLNSLNDDLEKATHKEAINLYEAIEQAWEHSGENSNQILMNARSSNIKVNINHAELMIILRNLLTNVKKYATPQSTFRVYSLNKETHTDLIFSNVVTNFKEQDLDHLFNKYWRSKDAQARRGTGVGLWISKQMCEKHNFSINACIRRQRFIMTLSISNRDIIHV